MSCTCTTLNRVRVRAHPRRLACGVVRVGEHARNRSAKTGYDVMVADGKASARALRDARKYVRTGPVDLYKFKNGRWSWAVPSSPIGQQLRATGEIYHGVPAEKWWTVGKS